MHAEPASVPVKGSGFPHKIHLEVVGDLHRSSHAAPQLDGDLITIICRTSLSSNCQQKLGFHFPPILVIFLQHSFPTLHPKQVKLAENYFWVWWRISEGLQLGVWGSLSKGYYQELWSRAQFLSRAGPGLPCTSGRSHLPAWGACLQRKGEKNLWASTKTSQSHPSQASERHCNADFIQKAEIKPCQQTMQVCSPESVFGKVK